jgi:mannose-6-phosphate isomerase class I
MNPSRQQTHKQTRRHNMTIQKAVADFMADPTALTAVALLRHVKKHPMTECFVPAGLLDHALDFSRGIEIK